MSDHPREPLAVEVFRKHTMLSARMSHPWIARAFAIAAFVVLALLVVLGSSQHRLRLIAGSYARFDSTTDGNRAWPICYMVPINSLDRSQFSDAVATLRTFDRTYPSRAGDPLPAIDQPDTCLRLLMEGRMVHCYNVDIGASALLAREQIAARLWDLFGPAKLGGYGHNLLEVFDAPTNSWKAIDPYYHCYYTLGNDTTAAGFPALRHAVLSGAPEVHIVHYTSMPLERPDSLILSELRFLAPGSMLHANNDFRWRYDHRYAWLTPVAASLLDKLPLRTARGVRTLMLGDDDRRYILKDEYAPRYFIHRYKDLFWSLLGLFLIAVAGTLIFRYRSKGPKHKNAPTTSERSAASGSKRVPDLVL